LLDTNVLIAAFVSRGRCADLLERCAEAHELVTSEALLEEYRDKLIRKFRLDSAQADARVALLRSVMHIVKPEPLPAPASRDPDDDLVLATATAGTCRCIVTGDKDLLVLSQYAGVDILTPGEFAKYEP
jgi:putative PIN family toxin of toxin-antitoxin system